MTNAPTTDDWSGARGRQWAENLSGMEGMLAPITGPLIEALRLDGPCSVAEIGCGGGRFGQDLGAALPDGGTVLGVDVSADLIDRAQMFDTDDDVHYAVMNAETETPDGAPFDRLVSRFGIMFFDDPKAAFANLGGWLKPGGRFAFAVWAAPADNPWMTKVRQIVGEIVDLPEPDPQGPGPFRYAASEELTTLLDHAGFSDVAVNDWTGDLPIGGGLAPESAADFALSSMGDLMGRLDAAGHDAKASAWQHLVDLYKRNLVGDIVHMPARVHLVTGSIG